MLQFKAMQQIFLRLTLLSDATNFPQAHVTNGLQSKVKEKENFFCSFSPMLFLNDSYKANSIISKSN